MMINTRLFGELEIDEERIITFKEGMPGFNYLHRFVLLTAGDDKSPFKWLQCVDDGDIAFALVNPFEIVKDYDFELPDDVVERLGISSYEDILVYAVVVIPEDASKASMNLKAPIVINVKRRAAEQVVLDTDAYSVRHYILEELRRQEVPRDAGINKKKRSVYYCKR